MAKLSARNKTESSAPDDLSDRADFGFEGFAPNGTDRCPHCDHILIGLPAEHRCTECGFSFDRHTLVWRPQRYRNWFIKPTTVYAAVLIIICGLAIGIATYPQSFSIFGWIWILLLCASVLGVYFDYLRLATTAMVIVGKDSLETIDVMRRSKVVHFDHIARFQRYEGDNRNQKIKISLAETALRTGGQRHITVALRDVPPKSIDRFIELANQNLSRYRERQFDESNG